MNKYGVELYSPLKVEGTVGIAFIVHSPMTAKQLQTYYECIGGVNVSEVYVKEMK